MTNTITELCDAIRQFHGQNISLTTCVQEFCADSPACRYEATGGKPCRGHIFPAENLVVRMNFCEMLSDRVVIHYSPFVEPRYAADHKPDGRLGKQRQLHLLKSSSFSTWSNGAQVSVTLKSGRLRTIDLWRPYWW